MEVAAVMAIVLANGKVNGKVSASTLLITIRNTFQIGCQLDMFLWLSVMLFPFKSFVAFLSIRLM